MNNYPIIPNAVMLDRVIGHLQRELSAISWLNGVFGRAQKVVSIQNGKRYIRPSVYCGGWNGHGENDYLDVLPDSKIGNFSFFVVNDPQEVSPGPWIREIKTPLSLVVWFDLTRVFREKTNRNTEILKAQVLKAVSRSIPHARYRVNRIYEDTANIYRGFTLDEVDNQCMIHPFGGFRIEGVLEYEELCD